METKNDSLESSTISALLSYSPTAQLSDIQDILPKLSSPLKTNFENYSLWLRFGLTLYLSRKSPQSALQAFHECMRIDQYDPLPAMLAAKLMLDDLNNPNDALELVFTAIERCQRLVKSQEDLQDIVVVDTDMIASGHDDVDNNNHHDISKTVIIDQLNTTSNKSNASSSISTNTSEYKAPQSTTLSNHHEEKCFYKNLAPLLSKCYLLASIMHAQIYEREPESIKQTKMSSLRASLHYLDLATKTYSRDYLVLFHRALHEAKQKSFSSAVDILRQAIKLNPDHVPSIQLLILSLSAMKRHEEALILCESALHEFEDNLLLLYIKCNLEQVSVETRGYKSALTTAQYLLKCIRRSSSNANSSNLDATKDQNLETFKQTTNLFAEETNNRHDLFAGELSIWLLVAEIFIKIGSVNDAELCVDEGSTHVDGALSYQIMFIRGRIAKAKNNLNEAKSFFQSCLALCPRHASALQQIAHVHYLLGNHSTAEKLLRDSLDVDSDCHKTWHYLSLVFIETNQHDKANECVRKAAILEESSPVISISIISRLTFE